MVELCARDGARFKRRRTYCILYNVIVGDRNERGAYVVGGLDFLTIRGAGHMVPQMQPVAGAPQLTQVKPRLQYLDIYIPSLAVTY